MKQQESVMEYHKVIGYLSDLIKDEKIGIGSKLPAERELAETLGIGRNSTREAVSILRGLGIVESVHGSGNYVSGDCGRAIRQIMNAMLVLGRIHRKDLLEFYRVISKTAIGLLADRDLAWEEKKPLEKALDSMRSLKPEEYLPAIREFHNGLIHAVPNPLYSMILEPVSELCLEPVCELLQNYDSKARRKIAEVHMNFYESLLAKDHEACERYADQYCDLVSRVMIL